jgi:hypothetical protein
VYDHHNAKKPAYQDCSDSVGVLIFVGAGLKFIDQLCDLYAFA